MSAYRISCPKTFLSPSHPTSAIPIGIGKRSNPLVKAHLTSGFSAEYSSGRCRAFVCAA
jgi:hypothetical protein